MTHAPKASSDKCVLVVGRVRVGRGHCCLSMVKPGNILAYTRVWCYDGCIFLGITEAAAE